MQRFRVIYNGISQESLVFFGVHIIPRTYKRQVGYFMVYHERTLHIFFLYHAVEHTYNGFPVFWLDPFCDIRTNLIKEDLLSSGGLGGRGRGAVVFYLPCRLFFLLPFLLFLPKIRGRGRGAAPLRAPPLDPPLVSRLL